MKRIFKRLAILVVAMVAVFACAFAVGCTNGDGGKDTASDYNFTIVDENGNAVNGQTGGANGGKVFAQLCIGENCVPLALKSIYPDAKGKISLSQKQINEFFADTKPNGDVTKFDFHVLEFPGYKADCSIPVDGRGDYTLKLSK